MSDEVSLDYSVRSCLKNKDCIEVLFCQLDTRVIWEMEPQMRKMPRSDYLY